MLVELVMAIGIAAIILPALLTGLVASRQGRPQQQQRSQATALLKETVNAVRSIKDNDWNAFAINGTFHTEISGNKWALSSDAQTVNGFTQQVVISDVYRDLDGAIASSGGTLDLSTKKAEVSVSWAQPQLATISATLYLTRTVNLTHEDTTASDFNAGTLNDVQVTNNGDGEVILANNNKAKWCSPSFATNGSGNEITIDLPDGPPVAVAATASAVTTSIPNDVLVATAPSDSSVVKLAYINVTADTATPAATQRGIFTMDSSEYSSPSYVPSGTGLDNNFKTTAVKYYKSSSGNLYALVGTDLPDKEVIAIWVNDGNDSNDNTTSGEFQDPVNKIFKYKTFFNTKQYYYDTRSTPNQDQSPFGYGASTITVLGDTGYVASGGYLYAFDLSNIDSKTTSDGLDMYGCRIQLDGYECLPGSPGQAKKYRSGETGTSWSDSTTPIHNDCSDGGNIELKATEDIDGVQVGSSKYIYVAIGGVTNPEFEIANVSSVPSYSRSNDSSCGTSSRGDSTWKVISTLDFDSKSNTEEAANSVYAKSDGTRAYVSSNGGIDGNHDGIPDSYQFYVINTSNKSSPQFLSGSASTQATSGYYEGTGANEQLYPRRSLTVQDGQRAVLVGEDGVSDSNNAQEYQVLDMENESTPSYCGGINFDQGFNDLTSVSEADNDNYVYMVANTNVNELKIVQGGPDNAIYVANGTYESQAFDTASVDGSLALRAFNRFLATIVQPANTSIKIQTAVAPAGPTDCSDATYSFVGPNGTTDTSDTFSTDTVGTSSLSGLIPLKNVGDYQNPGRCFKYKLYLSTTDQTQTPELDDITWNYSQ